MSGSCSGIKQRTITFKRDIRRNQLQEMFKKYRNQPIEISCQYSIQNGNVSKQLTDYYREFCQARKRQKFQEYISKKRRKYPVEWFHQFLGKGVNRQIVALATNILGQYYYYTQRKIPSNQTIQLVLNLFEVEENQILNNTIFILHNLLHDYREIKSNLVQNFYLVQLLVCKIEKYQTHSGLLPKILKIVYHLLNLSHQNQKYNLFFKPLFSLICSLQQKGDSSQNRQTNLVTIYNFHMLIKLFPFYSDLHHYILDSKIIQKMINLLVNPQFADRRFAYNIFDIIQICREKFSVSHIRNTILPFIAGLKQVNFQYGPRSLIYTAQKIKIKAYNYLVYLAENNCQIAYQLLSQNNFHFMNLFFYELSQTQSAAVSQALAKIFYRLNNQYPENSFQERQLIKREITRSIELNDYKYQIKKYFEGYLENSEMQAQL